MAIRFRMFHASGVQAVRASVLHLIAHPVVRQPQRRVPIGQWLAALQGQALSQAGALGWRGDRSINARAVDLAVEAQALEVTARGIAFVRCSCVVILRRSTILILYGSAQLRRSGLACVMCVILSK